MLARHGPTKVAEGRRAGAHAARHAQQDIGRHQRNGAVGCQAAGGERGRAWRVRDADFTVGVHCATRGQGGRGEGYGQWGGRKGG